MRQLEEQASWPSIRVCRYHAAAERAAKERRKRTYYDDDHDPTYVSSKDPSYLKNERKRHAQLMSDEWSFFPEEGELGYVAPAAVFTS